MRISPYGRRRGAGPEGEGFSTGAVRLGLRYLHGLGEAGSERLLAAARTIALCRPGRFLPPHPAAAEPDCRPGPGGRVRRTFRRTGAACCGRWAGCNTRRRRWSRRPMRQASLPALSEREALTWDYELLGLSPGDHPMRMLREKLKAKGVLSAADLAQQPAGRTWPSCRAGRRPPGAAHGEGTLVYHAGR